jgi:hypothetical protein
MAAGAAFAAAADFSIFTGNAFAGAGFAASVAGFAAFGSATFAIAGFVDSTFAAAGFAATGLATALGAVLTSALITVALGAADFGAGFVAAFPDAAFGAGRAVDFVAETFAFGAAGFVAAFSVAAFGVAAFVVAALGFDAVLRTDIISSLSGRPAATGRLFVNAAVCAARVTQSANASAPMVNARHNRASFCALRSIFARRPCQIRDDKILLFPRFSRFLSNMFDKTACPDYVSNIFYFMGALWRSNGGVRWKDGNCTRWRRSSG